MDRLSSLPDEVLCHILSFLPTKHAALSSVLSKRWLNLWKLVPNLDIDDSVFLHPEDGKGEREEIRQSFVHFVDSVLARQGDSPIKNFSLKCISCLPHGIVNSWICNVLQRGVSDLNLFLDFTDDEDNYYLPDEMFFSNTLVKLKIRNDRCVDWCHEDMGSSLPMLKSLDIDSEVICYGEIKKFVPSFPVLEELRMANMEWIELDITVSSASLRKLTLHSIGCDGPDRYINHKTVNPKSVSFDTPSLLYLNYSDLVAEDYPLLNMENLLEAHINLIVSDDQIKRLREPDNNLLEDEVNDVNAVLQFGNVVKLISGIQNVHKLSFSSDTLEVLSLRCDSMPVFNNLKFLGVTSEEGRGWQAMPIILRNCPHLETIIMEGLLHYVTDTCGDVCPCISREGKGRSLTSCPVNRLEIKGFRATMKEMNMIKHFLDYFPCLKRLDVFIEGNVPTQLRNSDLSDRIVEMFELYNELSPSCHVQLHVSDFLAEKWTAQGHI